MANSAATTNSPSLDHIFQRLMETREYSLELASDLSAEDMVVQPMDDASPDQMAPCSRHMVFRDLPSQQVPSRLQNLR